MKRIVFVNDNSGDWVGLYVNGNLTIEGHSLEPDDVLTVLGIENESVWVDMDPDDGRLPTKLTKIVPSASQDITESSGKPELFRKLSDDWSGT